MLPGYFLSLCKSGVGLEERGSGEQSGWREGVEKEANNNHHGATNPLKGDGWSKDGERGEAEGDGGAAVSLLLGRCLL